MGTPKRIEGDLGGQWIYKRLKCGIIHSVSAGEVDEHDRVCEKNSVKAKVSAEELVRSECKAQGVLPRRPSISAVTYLNSKLLAQWQGPYPVIRHVGSVNNQIDMVGKMKEEENIPCKHAPEVELSNQHSFLGRGGRKPRGSTQLGGCGIMERWRWQ